MLEEEAWKAPGEPSAALDQWWVRARPDLLQQFMHMHRMLMYEEPTHGPWQARSEAVVRARLAARAHRELRPRG